METINKYNNSHYHQKTYVKESEISRDDFSV